MNFDENKNKDLNEKKKVDFDRQKWIFRKLYLRKRNLTFKKKYEKNANDSIELWKAFNRSLGMTRENVNQSKIALEKDGAIQFQLTKRIL